MHIGAALCDRALTDPRLLETLSGADYLTPMQGIYGEPRWKAAIAVGKPLFAHALLPQNQHIEPEFVRRIKLNPNHFIPEAFNQRLQRLEWLKSHVWGATVVNEAWADDGKFRRSYWLRQFGPDYIEKAFHRAHEIAPDLPLYYCDYRVWDERKWTPILRHLSELRQRGVPIHGINLQLQFHLFPRPHLLNVRRRIRQIRGLGLSVMINELTVFAHYRGLGSPKSRAIQQAQIYRDTVQMARDEGVTHLGLWCWCDRYQWHWIDSRIGTDAPGLFDRDYLQKPVARFVLDNSTGTDRGY